MLLLICLSNKNPPSTSALRGRFCFYAALASTAPLNTNTPKYARHTLCNDKHSSRGGNLKHGVTYLVPQNMWCFRGATAQLAKAKPIKCKPGGVNANVHAGARCAPRIPVKKSLITSP